MFRSQLLFCFLCFLDYGLSGLIGTTRVIRIIRGFCLFLIWLFVLIIYSRFHFRFTFLYQSPLLANHRWWAGSRSR